MPIALKVKEEILSIAGHRQVRAIRELVKRANDRSTERQRISTKRDSRRALHDFLEEASQAFLGISAPDLRRGDFERGCRVGVESATALRTERQPGLPDQSNVFDMGRWNEGLTIRAI